MLDAAPHRSPQGAWRGRDAHVRADPGRSGRNHGEGSYTAWADIRLVRLQPARVALFRRLPLLPWRTVPLDRIPNPSIFCALIAQSVKDVRRDDQLLVELDSPGDAVTARTSARDPQDLALRNILVGGVTFLVGLAITWASYSRVTPIT